MTRSGAKRAAVAATLANGHAAGSSHACHTPKTLFSRQPESPNTTIRSGLIFGSGNTRWPIVARIVPIGTLRSQTVIGNADGLESAGPLTVERSGAVPGSARTIIGSALPSSTIGGHRPAAVIARANATPSGPSSTQADLTPVSSSSSTRGDGAPQAASHSAMPTIQRRRSFTSAACATSIENALPDQLSRQQHDDDREQERHHGEPAIARFLRSDEFLDRRVRRNGGRQQALVQ